MPPRKPKTSKDQAAPPSDRMHECVAIAVEAARIEDLKTAHSRALGECRRLAGELTKAEEEQAKRVQLARESNLFGDAPLPAPAPRT